ncbi:hypothetical protein BAUCODRAFT_419730 [Baudoinia panamericana UAMH 10762]|uniref:Uncharacterized protein n=1 Tax=Baudoinia panamericana (strain UAMH 10762) TaxID=717646 RepID=M2MNN1_BAUPA|nr:uncharacterized protein BAUCODRAFT_419730 [Baudoinia panamericana UAMH 10762]EMC98296.1 hypothetical protein BAUCODRAFT_419730 [Baudoinia panamericana UAMH 10762]
MQRYGEVAVTHFRHMARRITFAVSQQAQPSMLTPEPHGFQESCKPVLELGNAGPAFFLHRDLGLCIVRLYLLTFRSASSSTIAPFAFHTWSIVTAALASTRHLLLLLLSPSGVAGFEAAVQ